DERLYRASHKTFEEYCRERWHWSRQRSHQLIEAAGVIENLSTMVDKAAIVTERQVRELAPLPVPGQRAVTARAIEYFNGNLPSAKVLAGMVREERQRRGELPPEPSKEELEHRQNLREQMERNSEYSQKVWEFVDAIEVLSRPKLPIREVAAEIRRRDSAHNG